MGINAIVVRKYDEYREYSGTILTVATAAMTATSVHETIFSATKSC
jgi:hypothetical protein